jgi:guanylate kinase
MTTATAGSNTKCLEGVQGTRELGELLEEALQIARKNDTFASSASPSFANARSVLLEFDTASIRANNAKKQEAFTLPIGVIVAMKRVLASATDNSNNTKTNRVEQALQTARTQLVFTSPPKASAAETEKLEKQQKKYQKRMDRLRLQQEETKYSKLTSNLGRVVKDDDVTTKSMTYAASIGLNMIVAPISFGVLMYFFAGSLLDFFWPTVASRSAVLTNAPDIRKVIMGVISGVMMLFIEMILFVIRTDEMDKAIRKKGKKRKQGPFGFYSSATSKTFKEA